MEALTELLLHVVRYGAARNPAELERLEAHVGQLRNSPEPEPEKGAGK